MSLHLPVILGTLRDGSRTEWVARFAHDRLAARPGVTTRLIDPVEWPFGNLVAREWELPEDAREAARPNPALPRADHGHSVAEFVDEMARADGFLLVAPEYNHGYPGALKNMLDALYDEWNHKPFAMVGVGGMSGGLRMMEQLRLVVSGLQAVAVPAHVPVQAVSKEWTEAGPRAPGVWEPRFDKMFDQLERYALALRSVRASP